MRRTSRVALVLVAILAGCARTASKDADTASPCPAPDAADQVEISVDRAEAVIGMSEAEAEECAASLGWGYRVGRRDEEIFLLTADYVPSRITVEVESGRVVSVSVG